MLSSPRPGYLVIHNVAWSRTALQRHMAEMCMDMAETCLKSRETMAQSRDLMIQIDRLLSRPW